MPMIFFFGPDGSGKTTLAKKLVEKLSGEGFSVRLSWMRGTHTLASLLARLLSRFTTFRGFDNPYYGITVPRNLKKLFQHIEFVSALPIILLKFILPSAMGSWVVAERYIPDFITWVSITTDDKCYRESLEVKFLLALASQASVKIYVTATVKRLSKRSEESIIFLRKQIQLYEYLALVVHAHKLNTTNKSVEESFRELSLIVFG